MPTYKVSTGQGYDIEDGVYPAVVQRIEEQEMQYGDALKFYFDLGNDVILSGICNSPDHLGPKTKLYAWACAILGVKELGEDYELDTDDLVDGKCRVQVENREKESGTWATVTRVLSAKTEPKANRPKMQPVQIVHADDGESVLD